MQAFRRTEKPGRTGGSGRARFLVPAAAVVVALVVAGTASPAPRTGVLAGQVVRDATTIQCVRAPCLEPAAGIVLTILRDGLMVARPQTDTSGRFRLSLLPGRYALRHPRLGTDRIVRVSAGESVVADLRLRPSG
jgi:hypothetical protein